MRLWILSATTVTAAAAMGLTLGSYVTSPQRSSLDGPDPLDAYAQASEAPPPMADPGPREIRCTGCGPTLADRQYAAQMAGWDGDGMISGSEDSTTQDYLAQAEDMPPVDDTPLPRIDRPQVQSVRFADSVPAASHATPLVSIPVAVVPTQEGAGPTDAAPLPPIVPTSPQ